jgi:FlaA1/EpsC-like NDP-sugar epimerase
MLRFIKEARNDLMRNSLPLSHRVFTGLDGLLALLLALVSAAYGNIARIPKGGITQFLEVRVTLLNVLFGAIFVLVWIWVFSVLDLYRLELHNLLRKLKNIVAGCSTMAAFLGAYLFLSRTMGPATRIAFIFFISSLILETLRVVGGSLVAFWTSSRDPRLVIILGSGRRAMKAWRQLRTRSPLTVKLLGFVDDRPVSDMPPDVADRYLGTVNQLSDFLLRNVVDELLIAMPVRSCYDTIQRAIAIAEQVGVELVYMHDLYMLTAKQHSSNDRDIFIKLVPRDKIYITSQIIRRFVYVVSAMSGFILFWRYMY